jgi:hypothetical protein
MTAAARVLDRDDERPPGRATSAGPVETVAPRDVAAEETAERGRGGTP